MNVSNPEGSAGRGYCIKEATDFVDWQVVNAIEFPVMVLFIKVNSSLYSRSISIFKTMHSGKDFSS